MVCLQPAMLADSDQHRAFYAAAGAAEFESGGEDRGITGLVALCKELSLMQIPDATVANRGREAIIQRNSPRHERARTVAENRNSSFINVVPGREIIHDVTNRGFQVRTTDYTIELCAAAR